MTAAHAPRTLSHSAAVVLISSMKKRHIIVSVISPCQQSLSFVSLILLESSKISFEHARLVARIGFKPRPACYSGLDYDHRFINKRMLKLNSKKPVWRKRIRLTSLEVGLWRPQRFDVIQTEPLFSSSLQKTKVRLYSRGEIVQWFLSSFYISVFSETIFILRFYIFLGDLFLYGV